jgi:hypothetical protein
VAEAKAAPPLRALADGLVTGDISLRTVLRGANTYKDCAPRRGLHPEAVRLLRLARLPRFVWVVEALLLDSTSHDEDPRVDALLLPYVAASFPSEGGAEQGMNTGGSWKSLLADV